MLNLYRITEWFSRKFGSTPLEEQERSTLQQLEEFAQNRINFGFQVGSIVSNPPPLHTGQVIPLSEVDRWREEHPRDYEDTIDAMAQALSTTVRLTQQEMDQLCQNIKIKKPLMDRKYPHACFQCKKPLEYRHVFNQACDKYKISQFSNFSMASKFHPYDLFMRRNKERYVFEKQFKKWWKSPIVKFMCCSCYRKATNQPPPTFQDGGIVQSGVRYAFTVRDDLPNAEYYEEP